MEKTKIKKLVDQFTMLNNLYSTVPREERTILHELVSDTLADLIDIDTSIDKFISVARPQLYSIADAIKQMELDGTKKN